MRILLNDERDLTLSGFEEGGLEVDATEGRHAHFSALEMFAASFGLCTASVLVSYARQLQVDASDLTVRMRWELAPSPHRIGEIRMDVRWPSLPESRLEAARRAASQCAIHGTLSHPPKVETNVSRQ